MIYAYFQHASSGQTEGILLLTLIALDSWVGVSGWALLTCSTMFYRTKICLLPKCFFRQPWEQTSSCISCRFASPLATSLACGDCVCSWGPCALSLPQGGMPVKAGVPTKPSCTVQFTTVWTLEALYGLYCPVQYRPQKDAQWVFS